MPKAAKSPTNTSHHRGARTRQLSLFDDLPRLSTKASDGMARNGEPSKGLAKPKSKTPKPRQPTRVERPAVFTPIEAAAYLNVKPSTLKSWRAKGVGPDYVKRGARLIGYLPDALAAFLKANRAQKL